MKPPRGVFSSFILLPDDWCDEDQWFIQATERWRMKFIDAPSRELRLEEVLDTIGYGSRCRHLDLSERVRQRVAESMRRGTRGRIGIDPAYSSGSTSIFYDGTLRHLVQTPYTVNRPQGFKAFMDESQYEDIKLWAVSARTLKDSAFNVWEDYEAQVQKVMSKVLLPSDLTQYALGSYDTQKP